MAKQRSCEYHFLKSFVMTQLGEMNLRSTDCQANALTITPLHRFLCSRTSLRPSSTRKPSLTLLTVDHSVRESMKEAFSSTGNAAAGIKRMLTDQKFLFWLESFSKLITHVEILFAQLQSRGASSISVKHALSAFESTLQRVRKKI